MPVFTGMTSFKSENPSAIIIEHEAKSAENDMLSIALNLTKKRRIVNSKF